MLYSKPCLKFGRCSLNFWSSHVIHLSRIYRDKNTTKILFKVTCGIGIRFERRFCIDRNAPTNPNPNICGEGGRQRMVSCKKMDCPPKDYICNDTISNCGAIKQNCLESEDWESMKKNCKKTCGFCQRKV